LRRIGKRITVRVEGSGDILFKVVSAASICAKGVWEGEMDKIRKKLNHY
jgi:ribonuclease HII